LVCEREKANRLLKVSGYKSLPHVTDAYIEATGPTFNAALENAALALFDTMCNLDLISRTDHDVITVEGRNRIELLYNWLEALLLKFELEQKVYNAFRVSVSNKTRGLRIRADADGERFDRKRHGAKVEVKAVTYHRMEISEERKGTILRFILDL
jgi:SHS2 domain-containing protein